MLVRGLFFSSTESTLSPCASPTQFATEQLRTISPYLSADLIRHQTYALQSLCARATKMSSAWVERVHQLAVALDSGPQGGSSEGRRRMKAVRMISFQKEREPNAAGQTTSCYLYASSSPAPTPTNSLLTEEETRSQSSSHALLLPFPSH